MTFDCCQQIKMLYNQLGLPKENIENESNDNINSDDLNKCDSDVVTELRWDLEKKTQKKLYCNLLNNYLIHKSGLSKNAPEINLKNQKLNSTNIECTIDFNKWQ
jgi:hypothetical protein